MKWSLIIPIAFIASVILFGCTAVEEDASGVGPEPGEIAIEAAGAEEQDATVVGTEDLEPQ